VPDEINPELFARLAQLAALNLDPRESEYLRAQLNGQLRAIADLERIAVPDDVPPAAHGVPFPPDIRPPLRIDRAAVDPILAARILRQAPEGEEGYFVVPDIEHTQLT
jgi:aspartyl/glutamyl-tRNA(Asn/Gln) amidotransferase C subunit